MMPLNNEQRAALWDRNGHPIGGHRILSARPGTGKTTTLTSYCVDLAQRWGTHHQPWQGIAMLSYTNVAKDELQDKIRKIGKAATLLQNPHFVGTVDAFINQHIFLPHGTKAMSSTDSNRPTLVGEPYQQWKSPTGLDNNRPDNAYKTMWFDCYSVGLHGQPFRIDKEPRPGVGPAKEVTTTSTARILAMKQHVWKRGLALQSDANYLAYQTLSSSPALARAITRRFPVLIIDEAQDLTEIQHAIVDLLVAAGLGHVILVGDENQAIYEWNTARPELFTTKATPTPPWTSASLTQSYRCSPAICETITTLAGDGSSLVPSSDGKNKTYPAPVIIQAMTTTDEAAEVNAAIDQLVSNLAGKTPHDGNHDNVKSLLILTRGSQHARQLEANYSGITTTPSHRTVWKQPLTRDFLKVIYHLSLHNQYAAFDAYENLLRKIGGHTTISEMRNAVRTEWNIADDASTEYRIALFEDLEKIKQRMLDRPFGRISDCVQILDLHLKAVTVAHVAEFKRDCADFKSEAKTKEDRLLSALFGVREARHWKRHEHHSDVQLAFATAHASKGETHDAVLLVTKKTAGSCGCPESAAAWRKIFQHPMTTCEAKRIIYVAMSRAAQNLMILTPAGADAPWRALTPNAATQ
ncbi:UvrD-helicase domain-containing protein [Actinoplanes sp. NPDC020271]|uniref:UvrD-helicase domain-containing protein n=1 Tax=Actinoplanes sp. NPDC020271 TaxID=3363896 RepID=UPI00378BF38F